MCYAPLFVEFLRPAIPQFSDPHGFKTGVVARSWAET